VSLQRTNAEETEGGFRQEGSQRALLRSHFHSMTVLQHLKFGEPIELSVKYVQKRKLRANFFKTGVSTSKGGKSTLVVVLRQV
jgi:hypothetical protein